MTICCPSPFWKHETISAACRWLGLPLFEDLGEAVEAARVKALGGERYPLKPQAMRAQEPALYLGGAVDGGRASDWQADAAQYLEERGIRTINPRRAGSMPAQIDKLKPQEFERHVRWQLESQRDATHVFLYFPAGTMAAVSLFELGLNARSGRLTVCAEDGFWRKGNVQLTCERHAVPFFHDYKSALSELCSRFAS